MKPRKRRRTSFAGYASSQRSDLDSPSYYDDKWREQWEDGEEDHNADYNTNQKWETRSDYQDPVDEVSLELESSYGNNVEEVVRQPLHATSSTTLVRSRSPYPDLAMIAPSPVASPLFEFSAPAYVEFSDFRNRRILVDHFCNVISHLIVFKEDTGNPFRQLVLPLSHGSSPVMNAIFALSSAHLECRGIDNEEKSLDFHNRALQGLAQLIEQYDPARREEILGAIMLLVYYEVVSILFNQSPFSY